MTNNSFLGPPVSKSSKYPSHMTDPSELRDLYGLLAFRIMRNTNFPYTKKMTIIVVAKRFWVHGRGASRSRFQQYCGQGMTVTHRFFLIFLP